MPSNDMLPTARIAQVTWLLTVGWAPTPAELGSRMGITTNGAKAMLSKLALVLPLYEDGDRWRLDRSELVAEIRKSDEFYREGKRDK